MNNSNNDQVNKPHRAVRAGPKKAKKDQKNSPNENGKTSDPKSLSKATAVKFGPTTLRRQQMAAEREEKKFHVPMATQTLTTSQSSPPLVVAVVGPSQVGKSTLIRSLIKRYTKQTIKEIKGTLTVLSAKKQRLTFIKCNSKDLNNLIDLGKIADVVILMIDIGFGFDMIHFEMLNVLQTHGFPKIMGVLTHLDLYKSQAKLKEDRKKIKLRFWQDVYEGCKLVNLSGVINNTYPESEIFNLSRFLTIMKQRPLIWRQNHPYVLAHNIKDLTQQKKTEEDEKCDRSVAFYGYVRGSFLKNKSWVHIPGCIEDYQIKNIEKIDDPCSFPQNSNPENKKVKKLALKNKHLFAPHCDLGGVSFDNALNAQNTEATVFVESQTTGLIETDKDGKKIVKNSNAYKTYQNELLNKIQDSKDINLASEEKLLLFENDELLSQNNENEISNHSDIEKDSENCSDSSDNNRNYEENVTDEDNDNTNNSFEENNHNESSSEEEAISQESGNEKLEGSLSSDNDINLRVASDNKIDDFSRSKEIFKCIYSDRTNINSLSTLFSKEPTIKRTSDSEKEDTRTENIDIQDYTKNHLMKRKIGSINESYKEDAFSVLLEDVKKKFITDMFVDETNKDTINNEKSEDEEERKKILEEKKEKLKKQFDMQYDDIDENEKEKTFYEIQKEKLDTQQISNLEEINKLEKENPELTKDLIGFPKGTYVKITIDNIPYELVKNYNPDNIILLGGLLPNERSINIGVITSRIKKHRWHAKILKTNDPIIFSIGWRRFQSVPVYSIIENNNTRNRMLKYTPEHMHCTASFYAPLVPPNTPFLAVQNINIQKNFRIAATGIVTEPNNSIPILKKLKLKGYPLKIHKNTAFIKDMFNSKEEIQKFVGAQIRTVSGIRGIVKKEAQKLGDGVFRATFEDKIVTSDIIFLRTWIKIDIQEFYNPVSSLLTPINTTWKGMRNMYQLRLDNNLAIPINKESIYPEINRTEHTFKEFKIPRTLHKKLPYHLKPKKDIQKSNEKAVVLEKNERKTNVLLQQLKMLKQNKMELQKLKKEKEQKELDRKSKKENEILAMKHKKRVKNSLIIEAKKQKRIAKLKKD